MQGCTTADGGILGERDGLPRAGGGEGPTQASYRSNSAIVKLLQELEVTAATSLHGRPSLVSARYMLTRLACAAKAPGISRRVYLLTKRRHGLLMLP